ncbi:hypothetical protein TSAR_010720 [Trichomalopsis sarcophagae]|uniref:Uncharacterized protein n=1 Tax=Trichomalopsis sarcophagae TaxID=543379 RepID=A0A232F5A7_9HYME|nr:hypothetical protein TSAR_010720 [Trichomalopsis sarcophagae]
MSRVFALKLEEIIIFYAHSINIAFYRFHKFVAPAKGRLIATAGQLEKVEGSPAFLEDLIAGQRSANAAAAAAAFMNNYAAAAAAADRSNRMVSHVIPVSGVSSSFSSPMNIHNDLYHHYELQQGNGSLGSSGLGSVQDPVHSLKIKQEPFQLTPTSSLPPMHQGVV